MTEKQTKGEPAGRGGKRRADGSGRAISRARLWYCYLYTCPLSTSSSMTTLRNLILWLASYLDAFSTYPVPT